MKTIMCDNCEKDFKEKDIKPFHSYLVGIVFLCKNCNKELNKLGKKQ